MASCAGPADHRTKVVKDLHSEAAYLEMEAGMRLENGCRLVHCGESHGTVQ